MLSASTACMSHQGRVRRLKVETEGHGHAADTKRRVVSRKSNESRFGAILTAPNSRGFRCSCHLFRVLVYCGLCSG